MSSGRRSRAARFDEAQASAARERIVQIVERLPEGRVVPMGNHLSLEVRNRRFGWFLADHHGDGRIAVNFKATDDEHAVLAKRAPTQVHVARFIGRHGWIGLWLDVPIVDWAVVQEALEEAYRMVAPKKLLINGRMSASSR